VTFTPVEVHKEQNWSSPPLPKTCMTDGSGSRKKGILWDPQQLRHLEERLPQFKKKAFLQPFGKVQSAYASPSSQDKEM